MKRSVLALAALLAAVGATLVASPAASAHPLGNFTINRFAGSRALAGTGLRPTTRSTWRRSRRSRRVRRFAPPGTPLELAEDLELRSTAGRVPARSLGTALASGRARRPEDVALRRVYVPPRAVDGLSFSDRPSPSRIGWEEVTVGARDGARVRAASVAATSRSDELRAYPQGSAALAARRHAARPPSSRRAPRSGRPGASARRAPSSIGAEASSRSSSAATSRSA